jgi:hypothetical protein
MYRGLYLPEGLRDYLFLYSTISGYPKRTSRPYLEHTTRAYDELDERGMYRYLISEMGKLKKDGWNIKYFRTAIMEGVETHRFKREVIPEAEGYEAHIPIWDSKMFIEEETPPYRCRTISVNEHLDLPMGWSEEICDSVANIFRQKVVMDTPTSWRHIREYFGVIMKTYGKEMKLDKVDWRKLVGAIDWAPVPVLRHPGRVRTGEAHWAYEHVKHFLPTGRREMDGWGGPGWDGLSMQEISDKDYEKRYEEMRVAGFPVSGGYVDMEEELEDYSNPYERHNEEEFGKDGDDYRFRRCEEPALMTTQQLEREAPTWDVVIPRFEVGRWREQRFSGLREVHNWRDEALDQRISIHKQCGVWIIALDEYGNQQPLEERGMLLEQTASYYRWVTRNFDLCRTETDRTMAITYIDEQSCHYGDKSIDWDKRDVFLTPRELHIPEVVQEQRRIRDERGDVRRRTCSWLRYSEEVKICAVHPIEVAGEHIYTAKLCCDGVTPQTSFAAVQTAASYLGDIIGQDQRFPWWRSCRAPKHEAIHFEMDECMVSTLRKNLRRYNLKSRDSEKRMAAKTTEDEQQGGVTGSGLGIDEAWDGSTVAVVEDEGDTQLKTVEAEVGAVTVVPPGWVPTTPMRLEVELEIERRRMRATARAIIMAVTPTEAIPVRQLRCARRLEQKRRQRLREAVATGARIQQKVEGGRIQLMTPLKRHQVRVVSPTSANSEYRNPVERRPPKSRRVLARHPLHGEWVGPHLREETVARRLFENIISEDEDPPPESAHGSGECEHSLDLTEVDRGDRGEAAKNPIVVVAMGTAGDGRSTQDADGTDKAVRRSVRLRDRAEKAIASHTARMAGVVTRSMASRQGIQLAKVETNLGMRVGTRGLAIGCNARKQSARENMGAKVTQQAMTHGSTRCGERLKVEVDVRTTSGEHNRVGQRAKRRGERGGVTQHSHEGKGDGMRGLVRIPAGCASWDDPEPPDPH